MKKTIKTISLLLAVSLCLSLFGCGYINEWIGKNNVTDNQSQSSCNEISLEILENDSEIVRELVNYLSLRFVDFDVIDISTEYKIDKIKECEQAVLVDFNLSSNYYVCGYYSSSHKYEIIDCCCADKYMWVKFEKASEIKEYCNGQKMVVAFQINKADIILDLLSETESSVSMEHCQLFATEFIDGFNVTESVSYDESFVYINSKGKNKIYHFTSRHELWGFPTVYLDEKYYLTTELYAEYSDGRRYENDLTEFGKYQDDWNEIMIVDKYSVTTDECVIYYGLTGIDDFVNRIINSEE